MDSSIDKQALDNYITGHFGEDQFEDDPNNQYFQVGIFLKVTPDEGQERITEEGIEKAFVNGTMSLPLGSCRANHDIMWAEECDRDGTPLTVELVSPVVYDAQEVADDFLRYYSTTHPEEKVPENIGDLLRNLVMYVLVMVKIGVK